MDSKRSLKSGATPRAKNPITQYLGRRRWKGVSKKEHGEFARKKMLSWWAKQSPAFRKARGKLMTAARMKKRRAAERAKRKG